VNARAEGGRLAAHTHSQALFDVKNPMEIGAWHGLRLLRRTARDAVGNHRSPACEGWYLRQTQRRELRREA